MSVASPDARLNPEPSPYRLSVDDTLAAYDTRRAGLADAEAGRRFEAYGPNLIVALKRESQLAKYLRQFKDWMIALLLASAAVTGYLGDAATAFVLIALVLFNTLMGFIQEYRAEKTMQALEQLVEPVSEVVRDGTLRQFTSHEIVVGDVVRLTEGISVPADLRLIQTQAFAANEFAMTGESDPTRKHDRAIDHDVPIADRHNMAYAGTTVATGEALGVVTATGMDTELGRIARLSQSAAVSSSPLQNEMKRIAKYVTYGVAILSLVLLVIAVRADMPFTKALLFAVGFAVALVPQGLPAEVNTALAQAASILARKNALVKKLSAVETLGSTQVICTDKTGTLTKNEMTVTQFEIAGQSYVVNGIGYDPAGSIARAGGEGAELAGAELNSAELTRIGRVLSIGVLASNARLLPPDEDHQDWYVLGDPTEGALLTVARKVGLDQATLDAHHEEVRELPFDSVRKRMTSIRRSQSGELIACVKGSPEAVLAQSTRVMDGDSVRLITESDRRDFMALHRSKASQALRNIAYATRTLDPAEAESGGFERVEQQLILLGMVSMVDPIRPTVPAAVTAALGAGIRLNIVTGDFAVTAAAVGREAGLGGEHDTQLLVVEGDELSGMSDQDVLEHALRGSVVFSRVTPEDKMRIVNLVKESGNVVAVTGDGINDAPALRHADIGVAMGRSGTDVAKQAAEVVLLDDSFATLVDAIRQGRTIFGNIRKGVLSCFTSNAAELVVNLISLLLATIFGLPLALNVLQILAIDLLGEIFPISALGRDPEQGGTMKKPPRDPKTHILNWASIGDFFLTGSIIGALAIGNYLLAFDRLGIDPFVDPISTEALAVATSMTYVTVLICQLVSIIQRRSAQGFFSRYQLSNPTFWGSVALSLVFLAIILYVPWVAGLFQTAPLGVADWLLVLAAAAIFLVVSETIGRLRRARSGAAA